MPLSVETVVNKWQKNGASTAARDAYVAGVNAVTVNPAQKAADREDYYLQRVEEASRSGKRRAALMRTTLEGWKQSAISKGAQRLASGINEAVGKFRTFMTEFLPYAQSVHDRIAAMPRGTDADADQRALAAIQMMRQFRRSQ